MPDPVTLIATVQYSAKVPTAVRYANAEAGLFLQVDVTGLSAEDADAAIQAAYERIKPLVNEQVQNPEAAAVAIVQQEVPGAQVTPAQSNVPTITAKEENACTQCGSREFADFRKVTEINGKPKNAKYPAFKCLGTFNGKACGKGVWLDKAKASA